MNRDQNKKMSSTKITNSTEGTRIGKIERVDGKGCIFVDFTGNSMGPVAARITSSAKAAIHHGANPTGKEVLLFFENNDLTRPVIVDTMYSLIAEIMETSKIVLEAEKPKEVMIDGKRISFEAEEEIVLECGKASITLTKAGKIIIKGEYVLSHSSGENRIRGGSVSIN